MRLQQLLFTTLMLITGLAAAADSAPLTPEHKKPWNETFSMVLQGKERTYVVYNGNSYLQASSKDFENAEFLNGKDIMLPAKLGRVDNGRVTFYNIPKVNCFGAMEIWRTRIDGDNLYVFGRFTLEGDQPTFTITAAEGAPSDQQIIDRKLAPIPATDFDARLAVATWAREMGNTQGNREFWLVAADNIISTVVDNAVAAAEEKKDTALILKAMGWCQDLLRDIPRAAKIGSAPWIRQTGGPGAEEVAKHMRRWDLEFYDGQWRPRGEALTAEYKDRFAAIGWRDADGYYKLGRWADANSEVLPRARELSYRAYQAGFRANENHNGIRRELGMEPAKTGNAGVPQGEFQDKYTGIIVPLPLNWERTDPIGGDATWIDPTSDTAYITASVIRPTDPPTNFAKVWAAALSQVQLKADFKSVKEEDLTFEKGTAKVIHYTYQEGRYKRTAAMILAMNKKSMAALRLDASGADTETEAVNKQLMALFGQVIVPDDSNEPKDATPPAPPEK